MTAAAALPVDVQDGFGLTVDGTWSAAFRSMASPVRILLAADTPDPQQCYRDVRELFAEVARQCTRFDPDSDLMRANAAAARWHVVGRYCFQAVLAAYDAYLLTGGTFDPRVLQALVALGYDATWARARRSVDEARLPAAPRAAWAPGFDEERTALRVGPQPVDLGGIAKGLALRWAAEALHDRGATTFLIDAGGDVVTSGPGPDGAGWHVGVEDPADGPQPVAVLRLAGEAVATSSTRLLRWRAGAEDIHHLIDPATGRSARVPIQAVSVVTDDPAEAEVWSKALFVRGHRIDEAARSEGVAALWVGSEGYPQWSDAMGAHLLWWAG